MMTMLGPTREDRLKQFKEAAAKLKTEILSPRYTAGFLAELEQQSGALDRALADAVDETGDLKASALMRAASCVDSASQDDIVDPRGIDRYIEELELAKKGFRGAAHKLYTKLVQEAEFISLTGGRQLFAVVDADGQALTRALMATALSEVPAKLKGKPGWSFMAKPYVVEKFRDTLMPFKRGARPVDFSDDSWEDVPLRKNVDIPVHLVLLVHPEGLIQITNVGQVPPAITADTPEKT